MINFNTLKVGDYVKVEFTEGTWSKGGTIKGTLTKLWNDDKHIQGQVDNAWCFHQCDNLIEHKPNSTPEREVGRE